MRQIKRLYEGWSADGKVSMGHACVSMMRSLLTYGAAFLACKDCAGLKERLHEVHFKLSPARVEQLTAAQAIAVRARAHKDKRSSIALAQALQFELMLRQRDVIGEWVPVSEPEQSDIVHDGLKWIRGVRWDEIDDSLVLRHTTSKKLKDIEVDLRLAPMVVDELCGLAGIKWHRSLRRSHLPKSGAIIVSETTRWPWTAHEYRRIWREIARRCGVPDHVRNMDSRAGGASEARAAGADIDSIKSALTHSDVRMTQRYLRGHEPKAAMVLRKRAAHRKRTVNM